MGLDQYLYRIVWDYEDQVKHLASKEIGKPVGIVSELCYWRKCWMIHDWFEHKCMNPVGNTDYSKVWGKDLKELCEVCGKVVKCMTDEQKRYIEHDATIDEVDLTAKQKGIIAGVLDLTESSCPFWEIYTTYEQLKDKKYLDHDELLYWPWW